MNLIVVLVLCLAPLCAYSFSHEAVEGTHGKSLYPALGCYDDSYTDSWGSFDFPLCLNYKRTHQEVKKENAKKTFKNQRKVRKGLDFTARSESFGEPSKALERKAAEHMSTFSGRFASSYETLAQDARYHVTSAPSATSAPTAVYPPSNQYTGGVYSFWKTSLQYPGYHFLNDFVTTPRRSTLQNLYDVNEHNGNAPIKKRKQVAKVRGYQDEELFRQGIYGYIAKECVSGTNLPSCNVVLAQPFNIPSKNKINQTITPPLYTIRFYGYSLKEAPSCDGGIRPANGAPVTLRFRITRGNSPGGTLVFYDSYDIPGGNWVYENVIRDSQTHPFDERREIYHIDYEFKVPLVLKTDNYWVEYFYDHGDSCDNSVSIFTPPATVMGEPGYFHKRDPNGGPGPFPAYRCRGSSCTDWEMLTDFGAYQNLALAINPIDCANNKDVKLRWGHCVSSGTCSGLYDGNYAMLYENGFYSDAPFGTAWQGCSMGFSFIAKEHRFCDQVLDPHRVETCTTTACHPALNIPN